MKILKVINLQTIRLNNQQKRSNMIIPMRTNDLGIDISSHSEFPYNLLSNFAQTNFLLDGVQINSIEGFLQSLKTRDAEKQKKICLLVGIKAKGAGKKLNKIRNYDFKHLFWKGQHINRFSDDYQMLLKRLYKTRYDNDENFRFALEYSENRILKHTLGETDPQRTLLTSDEFTKILMNLRDKKGNII